MEEELFPSNMSATPEGLEEERRLFYVAITRAEQNCFISYAKSRFRNGSSVFCNPSRFLKDIDSELLDLPDDYKILHGRTSRQNDFDSSDIPFLNRESGYNLRQKMEQKTPQPRFKATFTSVRKEIETVVPKPIADSTPPNYEGIRIGSVVEHEKFGTGEVVTLEGLENNRKAIIRFKDSGERNILLKYARLKIVESGQ
jgi:DNA helicase-2/ATP-dependent DNA helicase PcrA